MRIFSWNVNLRRDCESQVAAIATLKPDVVVLQEVNQRSEPKFRELLADIGLTASVSGLDLPSERVRPLLERFVIVASRWPLSLMKPLAVPSPEIALHVTAHGPELLVEIVGVHVPVARRSPPLKVETQEGLYNLLRERADYPVVLCGDFNSPRAETADGEVIPFTIRRGARARSAELRLMSGLREFGYRDCFRAANGYEVNAASWYWRQRGVSRGFRIDHVFASASLQASACWYEHRFREDRLSDHSPIVADITFRRMENVNEGTASES